MASDSPTRYASYNDAQKRDSKHFLQKYGYLINLKEVDSILDVGCGDGYVTTHILGQHLGKNFKELVAIDVSEKMIKHAEDKYLDSENSQRNGKITFKVLDVMTKDVPKELQGRFDHVFSFYCFHWIHDFSLSLQNVKSMLKDQGDTLFFFLSSHPFFTLLTALAKTSKYAPYLPNFENILPNYFRLDNKEEWCRNTFEKNGFEIKFLEIIEREYTHESIAEYKEFLKAIKTFQIPAELVDDYYDDIVNGMREMGNVLVEGDHGVIRDNYQIFVVSAISI